MREGHPTATGAATSRRTPPLRRRLAPTGAAAADAGFTLAEVIVSMVIIGIVMTSLTAFFVTALSSMTQQSAKQAAVQLVDDGTERVRALHATAVLTGRDAASTDTQWQEGLKGSSGTIPGVAGYLGDMVEVWDATAATGAGANATLPTTPQPSPVNGVAYQQNFYVGRCWQPTDGGACGSSQVTGYLPLLRVVVDVTWPCARAGRCSYVSATLVSDAADPLFQSDAAAQPPTINDPGAQTSEATVPISPLQFTASVGAAPLTWSASGLPPGLAMNSSGVVSGTPTTVGSSTASVSVVDGRGNVGTASLTWVVAAPPTLTKPANQTSDAGTAIAGLQVVVSGGSGPYAWTASSLPAGLSINTSSGLITGTPTTVGSATVTVRATDALDAQATTSFTWSVVAGPAVTAPTTAQNSTVRTAIAQVQATVSGGQSPYTWSVVNLPTGVTMSSSGLISGTPTVTGTWQTTLTVVDVNGARATFMFTWTVQ